MSVSGFEVVMGGALGPTTMPWGSACALQGSTAQDKQGAMPIPYNMHRKAMEHV